jgi:3-phenylpropionate/trans-cinnamate dioxygenase ferredoxin reductase subunit
VSDPGRVLIVGGGVAAQRCAFALRKGGFEGELTMISAEEEPPYDRTLLSKEMLRGASGEPCRSLQPAAAYSERGVDLRLGIVAIGLDVEAQLVALSDGAELEYDQLVICSGGRPVLPAALACPGVLLLREAADLEALHAQLEEVTRLAIVGGGFIGGEVASSAVARGLDVTLIEAAPQPLAPVLGEEVGARLAELHRANGVDVVAGTAVEGIAGRDGGFELTFAGGCVLQSEAVVVGVGMTPAVDWLEGCEIRIDDGIVTDANCRTEVPNVLAAGDCARWWNPRYETLMRVEHWDTAARHGAAAAASVLGHDEPFAPVPFFWSDQHGVKFQSVGYAPDWDELEVEDGEAPGSFVARYRARDRLIAVFAAGQPKTIARARKEIHASRRHEEVQA